MNTYAPTSIFSFSPSESDPSLDDITALDTILRLCFAVRPSSSSFIFFLPFPLGSLGSLRFLSLGLRSPFSLWNKRRQEKYSVLILHIITIKLRFFFQIKGNFLKEKMHKNEIQMIKMQPNKIYYWNYMVSELFSFLYLSKYIFMHIKKCIETKMHKNE